MRQMIDYWSAFVHTGAPDVDGEPSWAAMDPDHPERMMLQPDGSAMGGDFAARHHCGFWASRG